MFFIISSNLMLTEGLEGFYHVGTIMEHGWKADLSPTLKDYKKSNQSKQMDKRRYFRHAVTYKVSVCIDPVHSAIFTAYILFLWLVLVISPLHDKLNVLPSTVMLTITSRTFQRIVPGQVLAPPHQMNRNPMRGAVFVGVYSVPPARLTASHAVTRSLYIEARNHGLSVFIYVVSGNSTRTKNKKDISNS